MVNNTKSGFLYRNWEKRISQYRQTNYKDFSCCTSSDAHPSEKNLNSAYTAHNTNIDNEIENTSTTPFFFSDFA